MILITLILALMFSIKMERNLKNVTSNCSGETRVGQELLLDEVRLQEELRVLKSRREN
jgi:hypothetical protein